MRLTVYWPAGPRQRFHPAAFDGTVGKAVPVTMDNATIGAGTIVAAEVDEDGAGVTLELEVDPPAGVRPLTAGYDELLRMVQPATTRVRVTVDALFAWGLMSAYRVTATDEAGVTHYAVLNADKAAARVHAILTDHRGDTPETPTPSVEDLLEAVLRPEGD